MFKRSKLAKAFQPKQRTREELDKEYAFHSTHYGHKSRVVYQLNEELESHMAAMCELNQDGMRLQKIEDAKKAAEQPASQA